MLPEHIIYEVQKLSQSFSISKRNWKKQKQEIGIFMGNVSKEEFSAYRGEIKECFKTHLRFRFTTAEMQSFPAPNIDDYAISITRVLRIAYTQLTK